MIIPFHTGSVPFLKFFQFSQRWLLGIKPDEIICFLHYPPLYSTYRCEAIVELLKKYGVKRCVYGHLHGNSLRYAVTGEADGIEWTLVSGDYVDFTPVFLKK